MEWIRVDGEASGVEWVRVDGKTSGVEWVRVDGEASGVERVNCWVGWRLTVQKPLFCCRPLLPKQIPTNFPTSPSFIRPPTVRHHDRPHALILPYSRPIALLSAFQPAPLSAFPSAWTPAILSACSPSSPLARPPSCPLPRQLGSIPASRPPAHSTVRPSVWPLVCPCAHRAPTLQSGRLSARVPIRPPAFQSGCLSARVSIHSSV